MTKREIMLNAHKYASEIKGDYAVAMSFGLKKAWAEAKKGEMKMDLENAVVKANEWIEKRVMWSGESKVVTKNWEKGDKNRTYITIRNYTSAWNLKHELKCGYIDNVTSEYVATKYDNVNLESMQEI